MSEPLSSKGKLNEKKDFERVGLFQDVTLKTNVPNNFNKIKRLKIDNVKPYSTKIKAMANPFGDIAQH